WRRPVCVRWDGGRACTLMKEPHEIWPLPATSCPAWLPATPEGIGDYLPRYEPRLAAALARAPLTPAERIATLVEARILVRTGRMAVGAAFELLPPLARAEDPEVMKAALQLPCRLRHRPLLP